jgi:hypothetical protein
VNKKFALFGKTSLPDGAIIALEKEAGIQRPQFDLPGRW